MYLACPSSFSDGLPVTNHNLPQTRTRYKGVGTEVPIPGRITGDDGAMPPFTNGSRPSDWLTFSTSFPRPGPKNRQTFAHRNAGCFGHLGQEQILSGEPSLYPCVLSHELGSVVLKGFEKLAILVYPLIDAAFTGPDDAAQPVGSLVTNRLQQPPHGPSCRDRDVGIPADLISDNQPKVKLLQDGLSISLSTSANAPPERTHGWLFL